MHAYLEEEKKLFLNTNIFFLKLESKFGMSLCRSRFCYDSLGCCTELLLMIWYKLKVSLWMAIKTLELLITEALWGCRAKLNVLFWSL